MPKKSSRKPARSALAEPIAEQQKQMETCVEQIKEMHMTVKGCQMEVDRQNERIDRYTKEIKYAKRSLMVHVNKLRAQHKNCGCSGQSAEQWMECFERQRRPQTQLHTAYLLVGEACLLDVNNEIYNFIGKLEEMIENASKDGTPPKKVEEWSATLEACRKSLCSVFPELDDQALYMIDDLNDTNRFRNFVPSTTSDEPSGEAFQRMVEKWEGSESILSIYGQCRTTPEAVVSQDSAEVLVDQMGNLKISEGPLPEERER